MSLLSLVRSASAWSFFTQGWRAAAGLLTMVLTSTQLSAQEQGWYYAMLTLAGLSAVFELGLGTVLVSVAGKLHEQTAAGTRHWDIGQARARHFIAACSRWFRLLALAFACSALPVGLWFFDGKPGFDAHWQAPWVVLVVCTAGNLLLTPYPALAQAGGQAASVFRMQALQIVAGSMACWLLLLAGARLWAALAVPMTGLLVTASWTLRRQTALWQAQHEDADAFSWRHELWPMQWRAALTTVCSYVSSQMFVPIMFSLHGPAAAAKLALGLALANMVTLLGLSWMSADAARLAALAVRGQWQQLDRQLLRKLAAALGLCLTAITAVLVWWWLSLALGRDLGMPRERLPAPPDLAMLFGWALVNLVLAAMGLHLRAHQHEAFALLTLAVTAVQWPLLIMLTRQHGVSGTAAALLLGQGLLTLPAALWLWRRDLRRLRGDALPGKPEPGKDPR